MKMEKELSFQLKEIKNGFSMVGFVKILVTESELQEHEIKESYSGKGWEMQGYKESIPEIGYDDWKIAIIDGLKYGLLKLESNQKLRIEIVAAEGLQTDTTPEMLSYASSRCIINEFPNSETQIELDLYKDKMYRSPKNYKS